MKRFFTSMLLVLMVTGYTYSENISIKGFGEIPVTKQGDSYMINLGSYGEFAFQGSLNPMELNSSVTIDQLSKLPGFKVLSKLGLKDISLGISSDGAVSMSAQADTKSSIDKICKLFKITTPYIGISASIASESIELEGNLEFTEGAVELMHIDKLGTSVKFSSASISTTLEPGSAELGVTTDLLIKPTASDPELESTYSFSYDLVSQTLTGSGSMMSEWSNPLGSSKFLKENSIVFSNAAVELGINVATLAPVNLGFAMEKGKLFTLDFGVVASIDPVDKKVAFLAERTKMNANDFTTFLREGFGLSIPDVLPDIYYIDQPFVKFAPNGGNVGEVEMEKGICLDGQIKIGDAIEGPIHFYFDMENEFKLHMDLKYNFRKFVMNELRKVQILAPVANEVLKTFQIQSLYIDMYGNKSDLALKGNAKCDFKVLGGSHHIEFEAALDEDAIKEKLLSEIKKAAGPELAAISEAVGEALNHSKAIASQAMGNAKELIGTVSRHAHSKETCDNECVPRLARDVTQPVLVGSKEALMSFYTGVIDKVATIEGENSEETRKLRMAFIKPQWDELRSKISGDWDFLYNDKTYVRYYLLPSSATNGGDIFRRTIGKRRKYITGLESDLWNNMMSASCYPNKMSNVTFEWESNDGTYDGLFVNQDKIPNEIAAGSDFTAGNVVLMSENKKYVLYFEDGGNLVLYKHLDVPIWVSGSHGAVKMSFGNDGKFIFYNKAGKTVRSAMRLNGNKFKLENNGELALKDDNTGRTYTFRTGAKLVNYKAPVDTKWEKSSTVLVSQNKIYSLEFEYSGNLVIKKFGVDEVWSSNTIDKGGFELVYQTDGNLVMYSVRRQKVVWSSNTANTGVGTLVLQDNGKLTIQSVEGKILCVLSDLNTDTSGNLNDNFVYVQNVWKNTCINVEHGLTCGDIDNGWHSAMWILEPSEDGHVKIKNRWKNTYLHIEGGLAVQCSEIQPGWHSAMWKIEPVAGTSEVRIKNRWKGTYLNVESGGLHCTDIQPGWASARWSLNDVNNFAPITVGYNKTEGCGTFFRNGKVLKKHCGWRKNWHTVLMVGSMSNSISNYKILFYDQMKGQGEIYKVDSNGNMVLLKAHEGWSTNWSKISWESQDGKSGLIKFELTNGHFEKYKCADDGSISLHSSN